MLLVNINEKYLLLKRRRFFFFIVYEGREGKKGVNVMTVAQVLSIRRYPVKSMMGEELNACEITEKGLLGDRAYGVIDTSTGKLANAKNPLKWPNMFHFRATFIEDPTRSSPTPPVRITLPDGTTVSSYDEQLNEMLSKSFDRPVKLATPSLEDVHFEGYVPKEIEELEDRGTIFTRKSPEGTFFDIGIVHLLTTSTLRQLNKVAEQSRIEARRFRPNLIIDVPDEEGFVENDWVGKTLRIGDEVELKIVQPTKRCVMTTLAQGDLDRDPNVLRSIVKNNNGNVGVYASVIKSGEVKIHDPVIIE